MDIELLASFSKSVAGFCYETFLQFRILRISDININNGSRKVGFKGRWPLKRFRYNHLMGSEAMLHFWAFCAGGRAASPTRPSSCCAAAAVAPTRRLGLPPEYSGQLATQIALPPQATHRPRSSCVWVRLQPVCLVVPGMDLR